MHIIHETPDLLIITLNGEQLKVSLGQHKSYVRRWTATGWQHFIELPPLAKEEARQMALTLITKLTGPSDEIPASPFCDGDGLEDQFLETYAGAR